MQQAQSRHLCDKGNNKTTSIITPAKHRRSCRGMDFKNRSFINRLANYCRIPAPCGDKTVIREMIWCSPAAKVSIKVTQSVALLVKGSMHVEQSVGCQGAPPYKEEEHVSCLGITVIRITALCFRAGSLVPRGEKITAKGKG